MTVRTRFAPSPTGRLHLGNVRIAVFNWLFTRRHGGAFVLRLEDTDVERNQQGSEQGMREDLQWLGLDWDEGPDRGGPHEPYRQSERSARYREAAERLVSSGRAYPCFCTPEELEADAERVGTETVLRYSGRCRRLTPSARAEKARGGGPPVLRFALPEGDESVEIVDEVRGRISFPLSDLDDFVILRPDGRPTYNFAVVVDDADMEITHVIRGVGHLSNTPKQVLLFDALGAPRPSFAHLPTVLAPGGGKLSKRTGAASVDQLRAEGYNPEGIVNYLSLLGWSSPDEREVLDRAELVERISLERVGVSDTTYDPDKLHWMSGQHIAAMELGDLVEATRPFVERGGFPLADDALPIAVDALRTRLGAYGEITGHLATFFFPSEEALQAGRSTMGEGEEAGRVVRALAETLSEQEAWEPEALNAAVRETGRELSVRGPALFHPVRLALTGAESGPDLSKIMAALGREETLRRLAAVVDSAV